MQRKTFLILILAGAFLAACRPVATPSPTPIPILPSATLLPSATPTLAPTPTATPTPAPSATLPPTEQATRGPVQGIILYIGDGMGDAQRTAGRWLSMGQDGRLAMDQMPVSGWSQTRSLDNPITDSAAGGTALASGIHTKNHRIGMDADGNIAATILEQAKDLGWSVGLVTTTQMAHATPASFAAHVPHRDDMLAIALQMYTLEIDVLLGGGEDEFLPRGSAGCYPEFGERKDERDLIAEAQADGYSYVCDAAGLHALDPASTLRLLGLFADEGMKRPFSPSLAEMTGIAIQILSQNPNGFFLMVEGGQVDWASHDNKAEETLRSVLGLDSAIAVGQVYAATHPNTLLIVTADHETSGMRVSLDSSGHYAEDGPFSMPDGTPFYVNWTHGSHTAADVPVTAQGPWSELLDGIYENTFIYQVMHAALTGIWP